MFGNNQPGDQTQTDNQQAADAGTLAEPTLGQPFNVTGPTPSTTVTPTEPTSAPTTDDVAIAAPAVEEAATPAEAPTVEAAAADSAPAGDTALPSVLEPNTSPEPAVETPATDSTPAADTADTSELTSIKQEALQQLSPLVDQLDQTPEEKFRTTMMMIQAADNQTLIKTAYDAAQEIKDEKEKAQALLDVINEINYFTQQKKESSK